MEAATTFTEALDYIETHTDHDSNTSDASSLNKQIVTLINNRSAMYEKGNLPELAVEDCNKILEVYDITHSKARQRKLRILEHKFQDYYQALVECCALQLQYMQQHRDQLRMGLPPSSPPPVQQEKLEELVQKLVPEQVDIYFKKIEQSQKDNPRLPSDYTLSQLLKSYTGYNAWMAVAARDGSVSTLKKELEKLEGGDDPVAIADMSSLLMKIGRRHIFDGDYASARETILKGYAMVEDNEKVQSVMKEDDYARLLEWAGMIKHWAYELDAAIDCYRKCAELEPINVCLYIYIHYYNCCDYLCSNYNFCIFEVFCPCQIQNSLLFL
ncbi:MAG: tetratricopeptide (TPR) repeat protein [Bacillariaceae sp.]